MHASQAVVIAIVYAGMLVPAAGAMAVADSSVEMGSSGATSPPRWSCPDSVVRPVSAEDGLLMNVAAPATIGQSDLPAQLTAPARGKPDYDEKVCHQITIPLKLKQGLEFEFSQKDIVSGSWWPGAAILHCDHPGTVKVTLRYVDTSGNKRVLHKTVRCSE